MNGSNFAATPEPPYYAVIFSSLRQGGDNGYGQTADRMVELASEQPGFLGVESLRGADGFGITVSYWESEDAIKNWKRNAEHSEVSLYFRDPDGVRLELIADPLGEMYGAKVL